MKIRRCLNYNSSISTLKWNFLLNLQLVNESKSCYSAQTFFQQPNCGPSFCSGPFLFFFRRVFTSPCFKQFLYFRLDDVIVRMISFNLRFFVLIVRQCGSMIFKELIPIYGILTLFWVKTIFRLSSFKFQVIPRIFF